MTALDTQIGGDHYKKHKIQPVEYITKNNLSFLEGCIVKRFTRYQDQEDPLKDLDKIKHEIDLIEELNGFSDLISKSRKEPDSEEVKNTQALYTDSTQKIFKPAIADTIANIIRGYLRTFIHDLISLINLQEHWNTQDIKQIISTLQKTKYQSSKEIK